MDKGGPRRSIYSTNIASRTSSTCRWRRTSASRSRRQRQDHAVVLQPVAVRPAQPDRQGVAHQPQQAARDHPVRRRRVRLQGRREHGRRGCRAGDERQRAAGQAAHDARGGILHDFRAAGARRLHQNGHDPGRPHHRHAEPLLLGWRRQHRIRDEHHPRGRLQRHRPLLRAKHPRGQHVRLHQPSRRWRDARVRHAGDPLGHRAAHRPDGPPVGIGPRAGAAVELPQGGR